jgi:hypothetical protein
MTLLHQALGRQIQFSRFIVYNPTTRAFSTMQQQRLPSDTPTHEIYSHLSCTLHTAALRSWRWQLCTSWPNLGLSPKRGLMNFTTKSSSVMAAMLLKSLPRQQHPHPLELWHDTSPPSPGRTRAAPGPSRVPDLVQEELHVPPNPLPGKRAGPSFANVWKYQSHLVGFLAQWWTKIVLPFSNYVWLFILFKIFI